MCVCVFVCVCACVSGGGEVFGGTEISVFVFV